MAWQKKGLIFAPSGDLWWARSYALIPTVDVLNSKIVRVYFASLDEKKDGRIGYLDLDAGDLGHILAESREPVLDLGPRGTFDDSGVNPSCVVNVNGTRYLYYIGWQRCERVPYLLFAGLAISEDGVNFKKTSATPILDRTDLEPFLRSATAIIFEEGMFKAWYVSGLGWTHVNDTLYPTYVIRYADSVDGIHWISRDDPCINFKDENEFGFGRPWVIKDQGLYKMWYSIRSRVAPYCIGYAESTDGLLWNRKDEIVGIERSKGGWDSEMICYPCVVTINQRLHMFYNGNRHGSTGFGYAVLEA
jgi:hypothetical protein